MIGQNHIESFATTLTRLRWENYARDYKQFSAIQNLYWHIVTIDYMDSTYHTLNDNTFNSFARRVYQSFMGIFYQPHKIIVKLEQSLEGFSNLYIINNEQKWTSFKQDYRSEYINGFTLIHEIIRRYVEHNKETQQENADLRFALTDFDDLHKNIEQVVSHILNNHLNVTRYSATSHPTEITNFPFSIPSELIQTLHSYGDAYFRSRFKSWFTQTFETNLPSNGPFKRHRSENIQQAFDLFILRYPTFTSLKIATLTDLIHLYSLDTEGSRYNKSSIRAFLKRNGFD